MTGVQTCALPISLKHVSLVIVTDFRRSRFNEDDELEDALLDLPETQFTRLSSSNSVSFDFEVIPELGPD